MKLSRLEMVGLRAFKHAELEFTPGMNLLVGINGAGKTTVLDALRICLSRLLPRISPSQTRPLAFEAADIACSSSALAVTLSFQIRRKQAQYSRHQYRDAAIVPDPDRLAAEQRALLDVRFKRRGRLRKHTREVLEPRDARDQDEFPYDMNVVADEARRSRSLPFALFFSTRRSLVSDAVASARSAAGGPAGAYADALASRELCLADLALWLRAQEALGRERPLALKHVAALRKAASRFLPECMKLRAVGQPKPTLIVAKGDNALDIRQLSDGERGLFALTLDLARRLSQANPTLPDPVAKGSAVVLIDELDLHLHPKWQRTIVERLTETFPACQFIATTHSPQIVAAVEPEQVLLLTDHGILRPERTLGIDTNWILRHLMEAEDRPVTAKKAIEAVEALIRGGDFEKARAAIAQHRNQEMDLPDWSVLEARMARMEVLAK